MIPVVHPDANVLARRRRLLVQCALLVAFLVAWELLSGVLADEKLISKPSRILQVLFEYVQSGDLAANAMTTLSEAAIGYLLGITSGTLLAFFFGFVKIAGIVFEPFLLAFYGIPRLALAPLFIIWFGLGIWPKVALVTLMTFFLTFFTVYDGIKNLDMEYVDLARIMGARPGTLFAQVVVPCVSPYLVIAYKLSMPQSIVSAVVGEFAVARNGLGLGLKQASDNFNTPKIFAIITILLVFTLILQFFLNFSERKLVAWKSDATQM